MRRTAIFIVLVIAALATYGQSDSTLQVPDTPGTPAELNYVAPDILGNPDQVSSDTIPGATKLTQDSTAAKRKRSQITTTINYNARDSMYFDINNRKLDMYGNTHIDYGKISLDADFTSIDWTERTILSQYSVDSLGNKKGQPKFSQGSEDYYTDDILYNFDTKRAVIKGVVTERDGAYMHGEDVKKNEDDELFIRHAKYTTCNLSDPHFFIESEKIKVIPGNKVVSGPFILKFREIPTPLAFPFGMFPQPREKSSGIVFPTYGEENRRGFFLRNGGYYWGISDYADLRVTGDIYSKGGYALDVTTNYKVRYKFSGGLNFAFNKNIIQDESVNSERNDFWIRGNLRPETRGNTSVSANLNFGSSSFNENNNQLFRDPQRSISSDFTSSVSFSQRFRRLPMNMSANFRQSQNIQTGIYSVTLPDFSLNVNRIYPFKSFFQKPSHPLAKISFSHRFNAKNEITNATNSASGLGFTPVNFERSTDTLRFNLDNLGTLLERGKVGGQHSIPVSTTFNLFKYFAVSPNFNYREVWYTKELQYTYLPELEGVRVDTVNGFSRAGSWSSGASVNTRMYGMYYTKGVLGIQAIRHVITPGMSFSYNPDFTSTRYGVFQDVQVNAEGDTRRLSKYQGFVYGSPAGGESKTVGFSLTNNIEMKVRAKNDSTQEFKKVKLFENLSISNGYNFAADSFKLGTFNWNARTSFFGGKVGVTLGGNVDPYVYVEDGSERGRRIDRYAWNNGQGLGNLSSLRTNISFSLSPKRSKNQGDPNPRNDGFGGDMTGLEDESEIENSPYGTETERQYILQNPDQYVDFEVPWSLRVAYNIARSKNGLAQPDVTSHGVQFSGSLGLTSNTQITFNSGYDVKNKDFTQTRISVVRDLHCWSMSFYWVPFGRFQSFGLTIRPKSALLQDLKIEKRRSFNDLFN